MKRYQCIKNVTSESCKSTGRKKYIAFKRGEPYSSAQFGSWFELTDELGTKHIIDDWLMTHFQELLPLNEDDEQITVDRYEQEATGCFRGAIWATLFITSGVVIYLALTWRS